MEGTSDSFLKRAVGVSPRQWIKIGGVDIEATYDTGSQVTTVTESFFRKHLGGELSEHQWFRLTAANGLNIPLAGYVVADVTVGDEVISEAVIMVTKDPPVQPECPCLLGMNII